MHVLYATFSGGKAKAIHAATSQFIEQFSVGTGQCICINLTEPVTAVTD